MTCVLRCDSRDSMLQAEHFAREQGGMDAVFQVVAMSRPGGVERRHTESHRVGDYFDSVEVVAGDADDSPGPWLLTIHFQPRSDARRYWKDMAVRIISVLEDGVPGVSLLSLGRRE